MPWRRRRAMLVGGPASDADLGGMNSKMAVSSPLSSRQTVAALLTLTAVTGLVDAVSYLRLGRVFVANMTGNVVFLGFSVDPRSGLSAARAWKPACLSRTSESAASWRWMAAHADKARSGMAR